MISAEVTHPFLTDTGRVKTHFLIFVNKITFLLVKHSNSAEHKHLEL